MLKTANPVTAVIEKRQGERTLSPTTPPRGRIQALTPENRKQHAMQREHQAISSDTTMSHSPAQKASIVLHVTGVSVKGCRSRIMAAIL